MVGVVELRNDPTDRCQLTTRNVAEDRRLRPLDVSAPLRTVADVVDRAECVPPSRGEIAGQLRGVIAPADALCVEQVAQRFIRETRERPGLGVFRVPNRAEVLQFVVD